MRRHRLLTGCAYSLAIIAVICCSCDTVLTQLTGGGSGALYVRVENATASFSTVTFTLGLSGSSAAASDGAAATDPTQKSIHVGPSSASNGYLSCENSSGSDLGFSIAATVTAGSTTRTVLLSGHGTGTAGFDDGSLGLSGERLLIHNEHYDCSDVIVVRITDDGSGSGSATTGGTAQGIVEHYGPDETIPDRSLTPVVTSQPSDSVSSDTITLEVENQTVYIMRVNITTASDAGGAGQNIYIPPGATTVGTTKCDSQFRLTVTTLNGVNSAHVVLIGDGTGIAGFDSGSIGASGDRTFIRGQHFNCGDRVSVTITDPGGPHEDIEQANVGSGTVNVSSQ